MPKKVNLYFEPVEHKYTDDEGNVYTSATTLIGTREKPFPKRYWAMYRALEESGHRIKPSKKVDDNAPIFVENRNLPISEWVQYELDDLYNGALFLNRSTKDIVDEWQTLTDVSHEWGNEKHDYLEDCVNKFYDSKKSDREAGTVAELAEYDPRTSPFRLKVKNLKELESSPLKESHTEVYKLLKKLVDAGYTLYAEKRVYIYKYLVSGTIDILAVKGKSFYIVDWKTNKGEIMFQSGYFKKKWNADRTLKEKTKEWVRKEEYYLPPLNNIEKCKGNGYSLQLSLYAYMVEYWGFKCEGLILCHIRHKETIKVKYSIINGQKVRDGIDVKKRELKPRIYPNIEYYKQEIADLLEWHLNKNVLKVKTKPVRRAGAIGGSD